MNWLASQTMKSRLTVIAVVTFLVCAVVAIALPDQRRFVLDLGLGLGAGGVLAGVLYGHFRRRARRRSNAVAVSAGSPEMVGLWAALMLIGLCASMVAQLVGSTDGSLMLGGVGIAVLLVSVAGNAMAFAARGQTTGKGEA
ncbi:MULTISPECIES: hypothetical protein [Actinomyces]|uniref:hypothetical protein n=1 Tax=Actinomyces TaxID=1654 RepID=UPI00109E045E|nr:MULTISPECIES: hypothetical protein [Actinomyces]